MTCLGLTMTKESALGWLAAALVRCERPYLGPARCRIRLTPVHCAPSQIASARQPVKMDGRR